MKTRLGIVLSFTPAVHRIHPQFLRSNRPSLSIQNLLAFPRLKETFLSLSAKRKTNSCLLKRLRTLVQKRTRKMILQTILQSSRKSPLRLLRLRHKMKLLISKTCNLRELEEVMVQHIKTRLIK